MVKVHIIECERGWEPKIDSVEEFDTTEQANEFCRKFNTRNNLPTAPDWYMVAMIALEDVARNS